MNSSTNESSRGYLLFAHNNASIDYACLALCNALLIKKNLLTVTDVALVTDHDTLEYMIEFNGQELVNRAFEHIIFSDAHISEARPRRYHDTRYTTFADAYYNIDRPNAYSLSPFEETMMIDVDYLILDNTTDMVWGSVDEFLCNTKTRDLDHKSNNFGFDNRFNDMSIPLYWATAVYFRKTPLSKIIFELMGFIREHWVYYQYLYRFLPSGYFRNDFALSIAIHIANNLMEYGSVPPLPVPHILFSMEHDEMHAFGDGKCMITSEPDMGQFYLHAVNANLHMMNKRAIVRHKNDIINYALS